ncbi:hypothetical protein H5410_021356 [Solanum commersonii]|uniref:Uncharacterized protein n=1 Tax=Solanum commersonii TaxID=4109 RepID=A0A9J5ZAR6_SOLCO|nr:hypothetical protein H5410_021356 [Solanum commersonii]
MGKSRLSVDLATHFRGEIINSDKMQVKLSQIPTSGPEISTQCLSIIIGGSNSYIEKLMEDPVFMSNIKQSVLNRRVDMKVDEMGWWMRSGKFSFQMQNTPKESDDDDDESKKVILQASISSIKRNTRILICNQHDNKIHRLIIEKMWLVHHIISTDVVKDDRKEVVDKAWRNTVLQPCLNIVKRFLKK